MPLSCHPDIAKDKKKNPQAPLLKMTEHPCPGPYPRAAVGDLVLAAASPSWSPPAPGGTHGSLLPGDHCPSDLAKKQRCHLEKEEARKNLKILSRV